MILIRILTFAFISALLVPVLFIWVVFCLVTGSDSLDLYIDFADWWLGV